MIQGVVIKAYNSFYYVKQQDEVFMCKLRGRFKKERYSLLVGDVVDVMPTEPGKGIIEAILPRRTLLQRPLVANVEQVILTFAAANPDVNHILVDRFLVLAEQSGLEAVVCINKMDLAKRQEIEELIALYRRIGYRVLPVTAATGEGIDELRNLLKDRVSVFSGPSGVGKSTLLNALEPGLQLTTGEVSAKIGRGKHTTRFAELLPLANGGFVVDTPGFSFTEFIELPEIELREYFTEMPVFAQTCKFSTCLHYKEPQCAVKAAVAEGQIEEQRYASYVAILEEIREQKRGY